MLSKSAFVQQITTSTRGTESRRFIGNAYYIGSKDSKKDWNNCIFLKKIFDFALFTSKNTYKYKTKSRRLKEDDFLEKKVS